MGLLFKDSNDKQSKKVNKNQQILDDVVSSVLDKNVADGQENENSSPKHSKKLPGLGKFNIPFIKSFPSKRKKSNIDVEQQFLENESEILSLFGFVPSNLSVKIENVQLEVKERTEDNYSLVENEEFIPLAVFSLEENSFNDIQGKLSSQLLNIFKSLYIVPLEWYQEGIDKVVIPLSDSFVKNLSLYFSDLPNLKVNLGLIEKREIFELDQDLSAELLTYIDEVVIDDETHQLIYDEDNEVWKAKEIETNEIFDLTEFDLSSSNNSSKSSTSVEDVSSYDHEIPEELAKQETLKIENDVDNFELGYGILDEPEDMADLINGSIAEEVGHVPESLDQAELDRVHTEQQKYKLAEEKRQKQQAEAEKEHLIAEAIAKTRVEEEMKRQSEKERLEKEYLEALELNKQELETEFYLNEINYKKELNAKSKEIDQLKTQKDDILNTVSDKLAEENKEVEEEPESSILGDLSDALAEANQLLSESSQVKIAEPKEEVKDIEVAVIVDSKAESIFDENVNALPIENSESFTSIEKSVSVTSLEGDDKDLLIQLLLEKLKDSEQPLDSTQKEKAIMSGSDTLGSSHSDVLCPQKSKAEIHLTEQQIKDLLPNNLLQCSDIFVEGIRRLAAEYNYRAELSSEPYDKMRFYDVIHDLIDKSHNISVDVLSSIEFFENEKLPGYFNKRLNSKNPDVVKAAKRIKESFDIKIGKERKQYIAKLVETDREYSEKILEAHELAQERAAQYYENHLADALEKLKQESVRHAHNYIRELENRRNRISNNAKKNAAVHLKENNVYIELLEEAFRTVVKLELEPFNERRFIKKIESNKIGPFDEFTTAEILKGQEDAILIENS